MFRLQKKLLYLIKPQNGKYRGVQTRKGTLTSLNHRTGNIVVFTLAVSLKCVQDFFCNINIIKNRAFCVASLDNRPTFTTKCLSAYKLLLDRSKWTRNVALETIYELQPMTIVNKLILSYNQIKTSSYNHRLWKLPGTNHILRTKLRGFWIGNFTVNNIKTTWNIVQNFHMLILPKRNHGFYLEVYLQLLFILHGTSSRLQIERMWERWNKFRPFRVFSFTAA